MKKKMSFILILLNALFLSSAMAEEIKPQVLPVDSDNDGVIDEIDECYKTEAGAKVDERGCYVNLKETMEITLNTNFSVNSSTVLPKYFPDIENVADFMKQHPRTRVVIEGHTDSDGSNAHNKTLSQRRANAVAEVLIRRYGIAANRVTAAGFGEERPLVKNDSIENKYKNRRVVAVIKAIVIKRQ